METSQALVFEQLAAIVANQRLSLSALEGSNLGLGFFLIFVIISHGGLDLIDRLVLVVF